MLEPSMNKLKSTETISPVERYLNEKGIFLDRLSITDVFNFFKNTPINQRETQFFNISKFTLLNQLPVLFLQNPDVVDDVFLNLDLSSDSAIEDVQTLKEIVMSIYRTEIIFRNFTGGKPLKYIERLNKMVGIELQKIEEYKNLAENNFFAVEELQVFLISCQQNHGEKYFFLLPEVFEIFPGVQATHDPDDINDEEVHIIEPNDEKKRLEDYLEEFGITEVSDIFRFKRFIKSPYRKIFEEKFSISLSQLEPTEQIFVVKLISALKIKDAKQLMFFLEVYGIYGLKSLMVSEFSEDLFKFGSIIDLANFSTNILYETGVVDFIEELFKKYSELISHTDRIDNFILQNHLGRLNRKDKSILQKNIRKKSAEILLKALQYIVDIAEQSARTREYFKFPYDIVEDYLNKIKASNILIGQFFIFLKSRGNIRSLSEIESLKLSINEFDEDKIRKLYQQNYKKVRFQNLFEKMLEDSKKDGFNSFSLEFGNELVGFIYSLEDEERKSVYVGGLNTSVLEGLPLLKSGSYLMDYLEEKYHKSGWVVEAIATDRLASMYIEKRGFVGTQVLELSEEGEFRFELKKNPENANIELDTAEQLVYSLSKEKISDLNKFLDNNYVITNITLKGNNPICILTKLKVSQA